MEIFVLCLAIHLLKTSKVIKIQEPIVNDANTANQEEEEEELLTM